MGHNPWHEPKLAPSPEFGGLPLWAQDPQALLARQPQSVDSTMLDTALLNRYPDQTGPAAVTKFRQEIGVEPSTIQRVPNLTTYGGKGASGSWDPDTNQIKLNSSKPDYEKMATLMHEYAHKADSYGAPNFQYDDPNEAAHPPGGEPSPTHHKYFTLFEPQMAQSIDAQRAIEQGWPVNQAIPAQFPWLEQVRPLSSNPLANPWTAP